MRRLLVFTFLTLLAPPVHGSDVIDLSTFPKSPDSVIRGCYEQAMAAARKGKALCDQQGFGDYFVCPPSWEMRLKPLEQCRAEAKDAKDQAAMLYLLGLLHQDFRYQPHNRDRKCLQFYYYQEGSSRCVYKNDHFDQVLREFPESKYADMAAFKRAEEEYRYYECEGTELCPIENQIAGWIHFLEVRPKSPLADQATSKIVAALDGLSRLSIAKLELDHENPPEFLLRDIENLNGLAEKLSSENRDKLKSSLRKAKPILIKIEEAQSKVRPQ